MSIGLKFSETIDSVFSYPLRKIFGSLYNGEEIAIPAHQKKVEMAFIFCKKVDSAFTYPFRKIFGSLGSFQRKAVEALYQKEVFRLTNTLPVKILHLKECCRLTHISFIFYLNVLLISNIFTSNPNLETLAISACIFGGFLYFLYLISKFYEEYHQSFQQDGIKV
jgi:hypothetical protein